MNVSGFLAVYMCSLIPHFGKMKRKLSNLKILENAQQDTDI